jgi:hypothetical protein
LQESSFLSHKSLALLAVTAGFSLFSLRYFVDIELAVGLLNGLYDGVWRLWGAAMDPLTGRWPAAAYVDEAYVAERWMLRAHILPVALAFALFPLQLSSRLRARNPALHRRLGRLALLCLALSMPASVLFALNLLRYPEIGGAASFAGFVGMAAVTSLCAGLAWTAILRRDVAAHRVWMIRAFGCLLGGSLGLRAFLVVVAPAMESFRDAIAISTWVSWIAGYIGADLWLHWKRKP